MLLPLFLLATLTWADNLRPCPVAAPNETAGELGSQLTLMSTGPVMSHPPSRAPPWGKVVLFDGQEPWDCQTKLSL